MILRTRTAILAIMLLASSVVAAAPPKEKIIWMQAINHAFGLYLSGSDGSNERPLLAGFGSNYNPSFSLDGRWIVFTSDERYGSADVFRVRPDGSGVQRLTDSPAFDDQGSLSPDGRTVAFVSTRDGGTANIWLLDIASHRLRNLITRNKSRQFFDRVGLPTESRWHFPSPIGTSLASDSLGEKGLFAWELMQKTALYLIHPDGSGLKRLTASGESAGSPRMGPRWPPPCLCESRGRRSNATLSAAY